jgi:hypothetical protein
VGYNWSAFVKARGLTWPIALVGVTVSTVTVGAAVPLMYSNGVIGLAYAFVIGEAVGLVIRGVVLARFFEGVSILSHLARAFAPTTIAAIPVLLLRASHHLDNSLGAAILMFSLYIATTVAATWALERPLVREAVGYMVRRSPQVA